MSRLFIGIAAFFVLSCANFYTHITALPGATGVFESDREVALALAREVALGHGLREAAMPEEVPELLASFGDGSVSPSVWVRPDPASIEFGIGQLGVWGETARTRAIRDALVEGLSERIPALEASVTTRRDLLPLGP